MFKRLMVITLLAAVLVSWIGLNHTVAGQAAKININTASAEELTKLNGIGSNQAARIIEFREKNGPFKTPQDLTQVPRIGQKTFEKNKDRIRVK